MHQMVVFSAMKWEGQYWSKDVPGGVETTPSTSAIYLVPADGSAPPGKVIAVQDKGQGPSFSPDGQWIYFQAPIGGHGHIFRCREDGSGLDDLTVPFKRDNGKETRLLGETLRCIAQQSYSHN